jgi:serine/threonine protein kinase
LTVSISLPIALWAANDFVFELRRYHEGVGLDELVLRNRFKITGEFLGRFHNAFVHALFVLHDIGVVHRDINPQNLLFTKSGDIVLLDSTFACEVGSAQPIPIDSGYYTAPEQLKGRATFASDFYSLGATEFFMLVKFQQRYQKRHRNCAGRACLKQIQFVLF